MGVIKSKCMAGKKKKILEERAIVEEGDPLKCFKIFDENLDGDLTSHEIYMTFKKMDFPISKNEVKSIMEQFDKDGNGLIDKEEFMTFMRVFMQGNQTAFHYIFNFFDIDGDGEITLQEFITSLAALGKNITEKEADIMLKPYYTEDMRITNNGFVKVMVEYLDKILADMKVTSDIINIELVSRKSSSRKQIINN